MEEVCWSGKGARLPFSTAKKRGKTDLIEHLEDKATATIVFRFPCTFNIEPDNSSVPAVGAVADQAMCCRTTAERREDLAYGVVKPLRNLKPPRLTSNIATFENNPRAVEIFWHGFG